MAKKRDSKRRVRNAYIVSTVSIALVLFLLSTIAYFIVNAYIATDSIKEKVSMSLVLDDQLQDASIDSMKKTLEAKPYVRELKYISKQQAAENFKQYLNSDFELFLGENPLPASFEVYLAKEYTNSDSVKILQKRFIDQSGVTEVLFEGKIVEQVASNITNFNLIMICFGGVLLIVSLILINNTLRIAIFSKRFIINTMKLVGATSGFIRRPFIYKAMAQGFYAWLISLVMLAVFIIMLNRGIPEVGLVTDPVIMAVIVGGLLVLSEIICVIFTWSVVRRLIRTNSENINVF